MNSKKVFSVNFFWQCFKQLKVVGIICSVILAVIPALTVMGEVVTINAIKALRGPEFETYFNSYYPTMVESVAGNMYLIISFVIITPIMCLISWNFLTKRGTSDFYHSLPYTRTSMFFSKFTAITVWQVIMLLVNYLISIGLYGAFSKYFVVEHVSFTKMYISIFLCNLLCSAAIALACTITGNIISNICMTGIILFVPRLIITMCMSIIESNAYVIDSQTFIPILDNKYNLIFSFVYSFLDIQLYNTDLLNLSSFVYTAVLSVIFIVAGWILFVKRKSETAGKNASGKVIRFLIRMVICLVFSVIGAAAVIDGINNDASYLVASVFGAFTCAVIGFIAVIIYEGISNKGIKSFWGILASAVAAYVVAAVIAVVLQFSIEIILNYVPGKDSVKYVTVGYQSDRYAGNNYDEYLKEVVGRSKITDKEMINMLTDELGKNLEAVRYRKENMNDYSDWYDNMDKNPYKDYYSGNRTTFLVNYNTGVNNYRVINLPAAQAGKVNEYLLKDEKYKEAFYYFPEYKNTMVKVYALVDINAADTEKIYNSLVEEIKTIDLTKNPINLNDEYEIYGPSYEVEIKLNVEGRTMYRYVEVSEENFPKTYEMICDIIGKEIKSNPEEYDWLKDDEVFGKYFDDVK